MKDWPYPRLLAHRGGGSLAPENTLAAVRLGASLGFRASEFDVKLARDEVPFLLHDTTLERTTSGTGVAGDRDWPQLAALDAGSWHSPAFRGERLARLDEVARFIVGGGLLANVEIKPSPGRERETGRAVAEACTRLWPASATSPLLSSFDYESLEAAGEAAPQLPRGWLVEQPVEEDFARLDRLEAVSLHCAQQAVTPDLVARVHATGRRLLAWTVNDVARADLLLGWGVDGLFTDNLREFAIRYPQFL